MRLRRRSTDEVERRVAAIWADVLAVDAVEPDDDFFDLGGNSLAAIEIAGRAASELGAAVSPTTVFATRTLEAFAQTVREARRASAAAPGRRLRTALSPWEAETWAMKSYDADAQPIGCEVIWLDGPLDSDALAAAFDELVRRHEILRTVYALEDGRPTAHVRPAEPGVLTRVAVRARDVDREIARARETPIDPDAAPPWRVRLLRVTATSHVLVIVLHEVISDNEGYGALLRDLARLYAARVAPEAAAPLEPPLQYRALLHAAPHADPATARRHWDDVLATAPMTLPAPAGFVATRASTPEDTVRARRRVPAVADALLLLARPEGATPFMAYLASFYLALHRWSGADRLAVTAAAANRPRSGQRDVIGLFSRILPLDVDLSDRPSFLSLLARTRDRVLAGFHFADGLPLARPALRVGGLAGLSEYPPSFRLLDDDVVHRLELPGVRARMPETGFVTGWMHMEVRIGSRRPAEVSLASFAGWRKEDAERMLDEWEQLLAVAVADPGRDLEWILGAVRPHRSRRARERRGTPPRRAATRLDELVERHVASCASAPAVRSRGETLSYGELGRQATALAGELRAASVTPGTVVGVALEPSARLVVAMLAILRLDATCALLPSGWTSGQPDATGCAVAITAGEGREAIVAPPRSAVAPSHAGAALLVQSAGTTGQPRVVALTHATLVEQVERVLETYEIGRDDRVLHVNGPGWRLWGLAVWPYLASGACVVVQPAASSDAGSRLTPDVATDVTVAAVPPPLARELAPRDGGNGSLRLLRVQGPGQGPASAAVAAAPPVVAREYGVVEAGGLVLSQRTGAMEADPQATVAARVRDDRVEVRDAYDRTAAIGAAGELCLCVGDDLVRTGDVGCVDPTGEVRFLGRRVDEIDFHGFPLARAMPRVEEVLADHPAVRVAATTWLRGGELLVACLILDAPVAEQELDDWLFRQARHLVRPAAYVAVEDLPLREDGSVCRETLCQDVLADWRPRHASAEPIERELLKLWRKVLRSRDVGVADSFFARGGTLADGLELAVRARSAGIRLTPQLLLSGRTITRLAPRLGGDRRGERLVRQAPARQR